ncbi:MAG: Fe-S cluster assembly protein SufD [Pyrinomonadaceae bacterium]|nr:Fe-S cluster assembly protein SufD [Pyrinomonadaceae bacterium]
MSDSEKELTKMSLQAGKETIYKARFQKSIDQADQPDWLKDLRKKAFEYFTENGFPTIRDEEWKYTDVKELAEVDWSEAPAAADGLSQDLANHFAEIETENRVVFVDGVLSSELTNLNETAEGVRIVSFADAFEDQTFKANLSKIVEPDFNGFTALNTAFIDQGVFINVPKNTKINTPIHLVFIGDNETANFTRILYVGETGSEAEIIEHYTRTGDSKYLTNAVVEIALADNAKLVHTRVQRESHSAFHIVTSNTNLGRTSIYDNTNITFGAKLSRHDVNMSFNKEGGEAWIDGLYLVEDGQHTDTHSRIDHRVKNCNSHQNYKGILDGRSRAVFNGKVFVHENASGTDANQSNKNLLLSNDARVDTKPQLEIFNDDVKCAHGATVGQLEEEELFYLLSRGLNEDLARNLLTYGFAEEIINKIEIPLIKKQLDEAVLNRLHARLEA